jgi:hypothetical protein
VGNDGPQKKRSKSRTPVKPSKKHAEPDAAAVAAATAAAAAASSTGAAPGTIDEKMWHQFLTGATPKADLRKAAKAAEAQASAGSHDSVTQSAVLSPALKMRKRRRRNSKVLGSGNNIRRPGLSTVKPHIVRWSSSTPGANSVKEDFQRLTNITVLSTILLAKDLLANHSRKGDLTGTDARTLWKEISRQLRSRPEHAVFKDAQRAALADMYLKLSAVLGDSTIGSANPAARAQSGKAREGEVSEVINVDELHLKPLDVPQPPVPNLIGGLERALFNQGVYQLRDPHSGVYNFDPYIETITPVKEFDFDALKEYITSSRDTTLINFAREESCKYTGSTSSLTSALAHFHFLVSQWRPINGDKLSRGFMAAPLTTYSGITRAPQTIVLNWKDGVYAIDAGKEYDTSNVLQWLGKSMEKFLTAPKEEYEKFKRENSHTLTEEEKNGPESYHYTTMGDFMMRSQLDAYDERLPGTGMFDLKTRAAVSIRQDATDFEQGLGYEIRDIRGEWASYEREYYDLMRSAFLKYSLQARMGRMDGIYVAYHNIERIFGFQYFPIGEMDFALHGTNDTRLGDEEFKVTIALLNKALDRVTKTFPEQTLQVTFETRPSKAADSAAFMYVYARPITQEEVKQMQEANLAQAREYEHRVIGLSPKDKRKEIQKMLEEDEKIAEEEDRAEQLIDALENINDPKNQAVIKHHTAAKEGHDLASKTVGAAVDAIGKRVEMGIESGDLVSEALELARDEEPTVSLSESGAPAAEERASSNDVESSSDNATSEGEAVPAEKKVLVLKIKVQNYINEKPVLRVNASGKDANYGPNDTWSIRYSMAESGSGAAAMSLYEAARARARRAFVGNRDKTKAFTGDYQAAIQLSVAEGKKYRQELEKLDEGREVVHVLENDTLYVPEKEGSSDRQSQADESAGSSLKDSATGDDAQPTPTTKTGV